MRRAAVSISSCGDYPRTALGPHASRVLPPTTSKAGNTALGAHASGVSFPSAPETRNKNLRPHASRVLPPTTSKAGNTALVAHASSVLPPSNKSKGANKARKGPNPALSLSYDQPYKPSTGTSVVRLHKTGLGAPARLFSIVSLLDATALNCDDVPAVLRLHNSRRNAVGSYPRASAVLALHNRANAPLSDAPGAALKNPSISAVTAEESRPRMVVQLAHEMASHLMRSGCGPIEKFGKISTNSTISAMEPYLKKSGKNSTNSMNSMPTHVDIGGAAPAPPLQFEQGHSGKPNGTRPQISAGKSLNNSANSATTARPTNMVRGALAPVHPWAFKTWQDSTEKSVNISGNSGGTQTKNGGAMGY